MQLWQAVLIGLIYYLGNGTAIGVGFFTVYRPLVAGFLTGLVLGDPVQGTIIGGSINLMYLGFISAGGSLPGDPCLAGVVGTTLVITSGLDINAALAVAVSVGLLGAFMWFGRLSLTQIFVPYADRLAAKGDTKNFWIANFLLPQLLLFVISFFPAFFIVYYGADFITGVLYYLGDTVLGIMIILGGMLPALGLGLLLKSVYQGDAKIYFFLGFLLVQFAGLDMVKIGLIAIVLTGIYMQYKSHGEKLNFDVFKVSDSNRANRILTKKELNWAFLNWNVHAMSCYNYERMMGFGFLHALVPVFKKLYKDDDKGRAEAMMRHTGFFNTSPQVGGIITGVTIAMEEQRYQGATEIDEPMITAIKSSLMGPLAGIGDTITQGVVIPLLLAFFMGMAAEGNILAPILYSILAVAIIWGMGYYLFFLGYEKGSDAIVNLLESGLINKIIDASKVMGTIVIGGLVANYVYVSTGIVFQNGDWTFSLQEQLFDAILPGMLPLLLTFGVYKLLDKKFSPLKVMLILVALGIVGGYFGILA